MSTPIETRAAAQERGVRTFMTGVGIDVAVAIAAAVLSWLPTADIVSQTAWVVLAATLVKTVLQAIAAYVLRLKMAPATEIDGAFNITDLPVISQNRVMSDVMRGMESAEGTQLLKAAPLEAPPSVREEHLELPEQD